jgi:hypothetical protein
MAHLPPEFLSAGTGNSKIVFLCAGNPAAVVVQRRGKRHDQRKMKFGDPHAALDWCMKNSANLYYFQPADPSRH